MEGRNVVIHLVINLAATMILGMSNTFQQLITSLSTKELRFALSTVEDSRVGTNSPFNINHKQKGKLSAWLQWILLIGTSLPVHFLANSVIGPTVYFQPPTNITSSLVEKLDYTKSSTYGRNLRSGLRENEKPGDRSCWVAFRTGHYTISQSRKGLDDGLSSELTSWQFNSFAVSYTEPCARYSKTTTIEALRGKEFNEHPTGVNATLYSVGGCGFGRDVSCEVTDRHRTSHYSNYDDGLGKQMCRLSVRMSAALILAGCLSIKAVYMITVILQGRRKIKTKCLTFGDVIAASSLDPSLQIHNECMVNAFDGHRHLVHHTCHAKHCRPGAEPSETGDSIGHCQKCKKFNETNRAADLVHPSIAIKYKKSLIANLGGNAITQMAILMLSSMAMFGVSVLLGVLVGSAAQFFNHQCSRPREKGSEFCRRGQAHFLKYQFGYFGGFDTARSLGTLPINSVNGEITAFAISNGAQLLYSLIYLLLLYNFTLIAMEHDWGQFERVRDRLRCTLVEGEGFKQSYLLQLPKKVLYPMMFFSSMMHWLLGQSISTKETIWSDLTDPAHPVEFSQYDVVYGTYAIWLSTALMLAQTGICWWAFTYSREGFMPQMYGSIRACCAATTQLARFPHAGIQWGDLGQGKKFRHAGFSAEEVDEIIPAELYCGLDAEEDDLKKLDDDTGEGHGGGLKRRKLLSER
ncbi:MAG: hypothetical protein Q9182_003929 [Xanthomendoza sp. 2 TL-2023]